MSDPKRLLELNQDCESPNVLLQNLLGAAQADGAPSAARQRMLRSLEGALHAAPALPRAPARSAPGAQSPEASARSASSGRA